MELARVILFTQHMVEMTAFYRNTLGLKLTTDEPDWKVFDTGACRLALHKGASEPGKRGPKLSFYVADVAAERANLVARGVQMGKIMYAPGFDMCDGKDPDGNAFQISARIS